MHAQVRLGFVFGPRALRRFLGRPVGVVRATGVGTQRSIERLFSDAAAIARFCTRELSGSFRRARISTRVVVGAVAQLAEEEARPFGPYPGAWLVDLMHGRVAADGVAWPIECWGRRVGVNAVLVLVDWRMFRSRVGRGQWAGFAPMPATCSGDQIAFHPVAIADLGCALSAHTLAHEFGHILGCVHEDEPARAADCARAYASPHSRTLGVMAAARRDERGRRLEWSRPHPGGGAWPFGDAEHDEASWLRAALPLLACQRFECHGLCGGVCA